MYESENPTSLIERTTDHTAHPERKKSPERL
jgi:hypothetical protein